MCAEMMLSQNSSSTLVAPGPFFRPVVKLKFLNVGDKTCIPYALVGKRGSLAAEVVLFASIAIEKLVGVVKHET